MLAKPSNDGRNPGLVNPQAQGYPGQAHRPLPSVGEERESRGARRRRMLEASCASKGNSRRSEINQIPFALDGRISGKSVPCLLGDTPFLWLCRDKFHTTLGLERRRRVYRID